MNGLDELKEENLKLKSLLDDPQIGLLTWNELVYRCIKAMWDIVNE